jgi:hypothetical protein
MGYNAKLDDRNFLVQSFKNILPKIPHRTFRLTVSLEFDVAEKMYEHFESTPLEVELNDLDRLGLDEYLHRISAASVMKNVQHTLEDTTPTEDVKND